MTGPQGTPGVIGGAGGSSGQIQYNIAGAVGGFTASGDATINTTTGQVFVAKTGGVAFAPSATTDTTTATNITAGTLPVARLPLFSSSAAGAVTASGGGTSKFARADGTWAVPAGGGGGSVAGLVVAAAATGVAATDTANLQAAINSAFNNTVGSVNSKAYGQSTLYIPGGYYVINAALTLTSAIGIRICGAGMFSTFIQNTSGTGVFSTDGCCFSTFSDMALGGNSTSDANPIFNLDWVNTGSGCSLQGNKFQRIWFDTSSIGLYIAKTGNMGSENNIDACQFGVCGTAAITMNGANALCNSVTGNCNIQSCGIGIWVQQGSCPVILGLSAQINTWDIQIDYAAGDVYAIDGLRTESLQSIKMNRGSAVVTGFNHSNPSATILIQPSSYGTVSLINGCSNGVIGSGVPAGPVSIRECQFNTSLPTALGTATWGTIENSYFGSLIDDGGSPEFIASAAFQAGGTLCDSIMGAPTVFLNDGATISWNMSPGVLAFNPSSPGANAMSPRAFYLQLGGTGRTLTASGMIAGARYQLFLQQDATGSRTITTWTNFRFGTAGLPSLSTGANAFDFFEFTSDGSSLYPACFIKGAA